MRTFEDAAAAGAALPGAIVAIGNFDGLHRGHAVVLGRVSSGASPQGLRPPGIVMTFRPHPSEVLGGRPAPPRLLSDAQRAEILTAWGIDGLLLQRFDPELAALTPGEFVERILVGAMGIGGAVVGTAFRFGRGRSGDLADLRELLARHGATAEGVEPVVSGGEAISSTRIRRLVASGDVAGAAGLLGRPYVLEGAVVQGDRRGRTLGFPTANVDAPGRALPAAGVYAALAACEAATWRAVVNVGLRPTFGGDPAARAEVHVLGEPGDLYGRTIRVAFLERLRDERRFAGPGELAEQIRLDVRQADRALASVAPDALRGPGF